MYLCASVYVYTCVCEYICLFWGTCKGQKTVLGGWAGLTFYLAWDRVSLLLFLATYTRLVGS